MWPQISPKIRFLFSNFISHFYSPFDIKTQTTQNEEKKRDWKIPTLFISWRGTSCRVRGSTSNAFCYLKEKKKIIQESEDSEPFIFNLNKQKLNLWSNQTKARPLLRYGNACNRISHRNKELWSCISFCNANTWKK